MPSMAIVSAVSMLVTSEDRQVTTGCVPSTSTDSPAIAKYSLLRMTLIVEAEPLIVTVALEL